MDWRQAAKENEKKLGENRYPGRGIVLGSTADSKSLVQIYWIMGRSQNSRNRVFVSDGDFVRTKAFDEAKLEDPSLIIYYPVKNFGDFHIVTNGDQTDTVYDYLKAGKTFEEALGTREFEPDGPNFTPRISGFFDLRGGSPKGGLSILKSCYGDPKLCLRNFYTYDHFLPGLGFCIHTYDGDGSPLPSFTGEPYAVSLGNTVEENASRYWNLLDPDNRVSLLVKQISVADKKTEIKIINKNG